MSPRIFLKLVLPLGLLCICLSQPALAWGKKGHAQIAQAAEMQLKPEVRANLHELLKLEGSPSLANIASWADELRASEPREQSTARWHFLNLPRQPSCSYVAGRDCVDGQCIIAAITGHWAQLADPNESPENRLRALKFLVHFVGDVHQPLHLGYADDRGGNLYQVQINGQGSNLHGVWDRDLADSIELGGQRALKAAVLEPEQVEQTVIDWAQESCRIIEGLQIYPQSRTVDEEYQRRNRAIARVQMQKAADRLALLLSSAEARFRAGQ